MKDRIKKIAPWAGVALVGSVALGMGYKAFFGQETTSSNSSEQSNSVDSFSESTSNLENVVVSQPTNDAANQESVVISTEPPLDAQGLPIKGNDSCKIIATTGEVFYIVRGKPTPVQGNVCLGRDQNGVNWWLAKDQAIFQTSN